MESEQLYHRGYCRNSYNSIASASSDEELLDGAGVIMDFHTTEDDNLLDGDAASPGRELGIPDTSPSCLVLFGASPHHHDPGFDESPTYTVQSDSLNSQRGSALSCILRCEIQKSSGALLCCNAVPQPYDPLPALQTPAPTWTEAAEQMVMKR